MREGGASVLTEVRCNHYVILFGGEGLPPLNWLVGDFLVLDPCIVVEGDIGEGGRVSIKKLRRFVLENCCSSY